MNYYPAYQTLTMTDSSFVHSSNTIFVGSEYGWTKNSTRVYLELTINKPFTVTFNNFSGNTGYFTPYIFYNDTQVSAGWTAFSHSYSEGKIKLSFYMSTLSNGGLGFNFSITT